MKTLEEMIARRIIATALVVLSAISIPFICFYYYLLVSYFGKRFGIIYNIIDILSEAIENAEVSETGIFGIILTFIIVLYIKLIIRLCEKICFTRFGKRYKICFWLEMIIAILGVILCVVICIRHFTNNELVVQLNGYSISITLIGVIIIDCVIVGFMYSEIADEMNEYRFSVKNTWVTEIIGIAKNENGEYGFDAFVVDDFHPLFAKNKTLGPLLEEYISSIVSDSIVEAYTATMGSIAHGTTFQPTSVLYIERDVDKGTLILKSFTRELIKSHLKKDKALIPLPRLNGIWERQYPDEILKCRHGKRSGA